MKKILQHWLGMDDLYKENNKLVDLVKNLSGLIEYRTRGWQMGDTYEDNSRLGFIMGALKALEKESGKKFQWHWENDPAYVAPEVNVPQIRVCTLKKSK